MRSVRVIPCLDVDGGRVVKGVRFVDLVDAGDPVELAARYDAEGADELVFLDITASSDDRATMVDVVARTAEEVFIPLTVGGGVRTVDDARRLLRAGADKVGVNTAAVERPALVAELAAEFGAQCVVVAVDARAPTGRHRLGGLHPRRAHAHAGSTPSPGPAAAPAGRGRDPAHLHGPRRDPRRLRPGAHPGRGRRRAACRWWPRGGGHARPPGGGRRWTAGPTPCWRRRSSTGASTPWARPSATWPPPA